MRVNDQICLLDARHGSLVDYGLEPGWQEAIMIGQMRND